nr:DUF262 domain-containing protein [uncultured Amphritea sp.]
MNDAITELSIKSLLSDSHQYVVPMYQRNYAWGEAEINQLVQDVVDYQQKKHERYYIGTLVVFKRSDGGFEVIDGQQRFTTLTLLAMYLRNLTLLEGSKLKLPRMNWYQKINISFESRPRSTHTFTALSQRKPLHLLNGEGYNESILKGYALIEKALMQLQVCSVKAFADYMFKHVQIMRVEVPAGTNLNHYFEAMNNRGEQLEKHEVLKAKLMAVLNTIEDDDDRHARINALQKVWEACANMERYIQYGFSVSERHRLFGKNDWGQFIPQNFDELLECLDESEENALTLSMLDIVRNSPRPQNELGDESGDVLDRFNSVINFSNFLLHVLRVYKVEDVSLDDKQLLGQFDEYLLDGDSTDLVEDFVFALFRCKYLFDQYIIKREFSQGQDGWSLKRLKWYSTKSVSFINSFDDNEGNYEGINRQILMLLAAFHVSTPTLVYKHWLNAALYYLFYEEEVNVKDYLSYLFNIARRFVFDRYLALGGSKTFYGMIYDEGDDYSPGNIKLKDIDGNRLLFGEIENNFVFNYLDYLLWLKGKGSDPVVNEFEFTFRSSVEHFYPQHPMDGHPPLGSRCLHEFGNLCLISHSKNSRLSNLPPKAKLAHFSAAVKHKTIDSLKLYEMIKLLEANNEWSEGEIKQHGGDMLNLLLGSTLVKKKQGL